MIKNEVGDLKEIYTFKADVFEKEHEFKNANDTLLTAYHQNLEGIKDEYFGFEKRMEIRINRELGSTTIPDKEVSDYIYNEIAKVSFFYIK